MFSFFDAWPLRKAENHFEHSNRFINVRQAVRPSRSPEFDDKDIKSLADRRALDDSGHFGGDSGIHDRCVC